MTTEGEAPTREEIEKQLQNILRSKTFATRPVLRRLLERLVNDTLHGTADGDGYETVLAVDVFRKLKDWHPLQGTVVREGMRNLRKHRDAYYSAEGDGDPVDIAFPPRTGYAAQFSYRGASNAEETVHGLAIAFSYAFPNIRRCRTIISELEECIAKHPLYAPAYAVLAEIFLTFSSYFAPSDGHAVEMGPLLPRAEEAIETGMRLNGELWRLHVMAGAIHCSRFAWDKADAAFKIAFRLAPEETRAHFLYAAFLLAVGRMEEAKDAVLYRTERSGVPLMAYIVPLFRQLWRQFEEARPAVVAEWPFLKKIASGPSCFKRAGTMGIKDMQTGSLTSCLVDAMNSVLAQTNEKRCGKSPVSRALALMGVRGSEARAEMESAYDKGHPLMRWLHLWPLFAALRRNSRFMLFIEDATPP